MNSFFVKLVSASIVLVSSGSHLRADCTELPAFSNADTLSLRFCEQVVAANQKGVVPVIKKKKGCNKGGPSSKCNPASSELPSIDIAGLQWFSQNGGFGFRVLDRKEPYDNWSESVGSGWAMEIEESRILDPYASSVIASGHHTMGHRDFDWSMTDPEALSPEDDFQRNLQARQPWVKNALGDGGIVYFVVQED